MNPVAQAQSLAARHKYEQRCEDCGGSDFVDDLQQGDLICRVRRRPPPRPLDLIPVPLQALLGEERAAKLSSLFFQPLLQPWWDAHRLRCR